MSLIVEYETRVKWLHGALSVAPEMTLTYEHLSFTADGWTKWVLWASGGSFEAFERGLTEDETVEQWSRVTELSEKRLYAVVLSGRPEEFVLSVATELDVQYLDVTLDHRRALIRVRCPSHEAFRRIREAVLSRYDEFVVRKLYEERDPASTAGSIVSPLQREALCLALESGYYEVPRGTTLEAVAADLGISDQALSARLRRGTASVLRETLSCE